MAWGRGGGGSVKGGSGSGSGQPLYTVSCACVASIYHACHLKEIMHANLHH